MEFKLLRHARNFLNSHALNKSSAKLQRDVKAQFSLLEHVTYLNNECIVDNRNRHEKGKKSLYQPLSHIDLIFARSLNIFF